MISEALDTLISTFSPGWGLKRAVARATMQQINAMTGSGTASGYKAGQLSRLTKANRGSNLNENAQPRSDILNLRISSWGLYRNNSQARKIIRNLESKIIGNGMQPVSQAVLADGSPNVPFRNAVKKLWKSMLNRMDDRGRPGFGGQTLTGLGRLALKSTVLSGDCFYRIITPEKNPGQSPSMNMLPQISLQLVSVDRLASQPAESRSSIKGHQFFHGIELDSKDRIVGYHINRYHPSDPRGQSAVEDVVFVPSSSMGHVFIQDDIDQLLGTPWFSAALLKMRDTADYEYNELRAAAVSACVVLGYRRSAGQTQFGVNQPDDWDLTDADGNKLTAIQPGMLLDLGKTGEIQGFNPMRPNANAGEFIAHMLRSQATSVPGTKGSTLTSDYRNSSFSSERSADNDVWPELEVLQEWFSDNFYQPVYERIITTAVATGYFDGIVSVGDFQSRKEEYLACQWQGPVARSINPVDDAKASKERIRNGQSSPQLECALMGRDWQDVMKQVSEFIEFCEENDIPEDIMYQILGIEQTDSMLIAQEDGSSSESSSEEDSEDSSDTDAGV